MRKSKQKQPKQKKHFRLIKIANPIHTENQLRNFTSRTVQEKKFNGGLVKFSFLYDIKKRWITYLLIILIGLTMATVTTILIQSTGLYTGGFGALFQGVARLVYSSCVDQISHEKLLVIYNGLFWGLYFLLNIPLTIFAYKKISKRFALQSIVFNITTQSFGFLLGSGFFNEHIANSIDGFQIFGSTDTVNALLKDHNVKSIIFSPNYVPFYDETNGTFDWTKLFTSADTYGAYAQTLDPKQDNNYSWIFSQVTDDNVSRAFLLFVYSAIYAGFSGVCYTLVFILGGSTAGSDYITVYLSQIKNKDVGSIFIILNAINMTIGILLGSYISGGLVGSNTSVIINPTELTRITHANYWGWQYIFSANFFASLCWVILNGIFMNKLFPWHKLIRVEIYSNKSAKINEELKGIKYTHPTTLMDSIGGYSGQSGKVLVTICMTIELNELVKIVRSIDEKCLISTSYIASIDGTMRMQNYTC